LTGTGIFTGLLAWKVIFEKQVYFSAGKIMGKKAGIFDRFKNPITIV
jgi:hypothetical protein